MDRMESGWLMLGLAPLAWLVGVFFGGVENYGLPLGIILLGIGLAGWAVPLERRYAGALGLLIAAFGMAFFYDFSFSGGGLAGFAGLVYMLAALVAAVVVLSGQRVAQAACCGAFAFAGLLWVLSDLASLTWQGGNLLTLAGGVLAAFGSLRDR